MTYEKQRIALAELEGWTGPFKIDALDYTLCGTTPQGGYDEIPQYNLDDCQRVFKGLTQEQKERVVLGLAAHLYISTRRYDSIEIYDIADILGLGPEQWQEQILRATGKWKEGES